MRETIVWLLTSNQQSRAESMKREFKLADRQFAVWKVTAFADARRWSELEAYAKAKKTPLGLLVSFGGKFK